MTTEEIRKGAQDNRNFKDVAYRFVNGKIEYLTATRGLDKKLSCGYVSTDGWICIETEKPLT